MNKILDVVLPMFGAYVVLILSGSLYDYGWPQDWVGWLVWAAFVPAICFTLAFVTRKDRLPHKPVIDTGNGDAATAVIVATLAQDETLRERIANELGADANNAAAAKAYMLAAMRDTKMRKLRDQVAMEAIRRADWDAVTRQLDGGVNWKSIGS
jgi:branched-subunit amino acid ABC-type transport system permease component